MNKGYVKLWRKYADSEVFKMGAIAVHVWFYLLTKATHRPHEQEIGVGKKARTIILNNGQTVFGLNTSSAKRGMNQRTVGRIIDKFILKNMVTRTVEFSSRAVPSRSTPAVPICSVITICNWDKYQHLDDPSKKDVVQRGSANIQEHIPTTITDISMGDGGTPWLCSNLNCHNVNSNEESICMCGVYR